MKRAAKKWGFALIATLVVVVLLTIAVVAFVSTSAIDRSSAQAFRDLRSAEFAAQGATDAAIHRIMTGMLQKPYHGVGYRAHDGQLLPVIYGSSSFNPGTGTFPEYVYLVSTEAPDSPPAAGAPSVDINSTHSETQTLGWIGSPAGSSGPIPIRVPWVNVLRDPTQPEQANPNQPGYNPVIARHAYYVMDETSRVDIMQTGNADAGGAFQRHMGTAVSDIDLGALPLVAGNPLPPGDATINPEIFAMRNRLRITDARFLNRVPGLDSSVYEKVKFYSTSHSLSNELAGTGRRRTNINALITNTNSAAEIAKDLDDIMYVISGRKPLGSSGRIFENASLSSGMPEFGRRFYPGVTSLDHRDMYLTKVAANIRDYIDADSLPTLVSAENQVVANGRKQNGEAFPQAINRTAWSSGTEPIAVGKEAIPYLQEHLWRGRAERWVVTGSGANEIAEFTVSVDQYFEFYNPSTKSYTAPVGSYLSVSSRPTFDAGPDYEPVELPDMILDISGLEFPAGVATVITTDPDPPAAILLSENLHKISLETSQRVFTGWTHNRYSSGSPRVRLKLETRTSANVDCFTSAVWGVGNDILDAHPYIAISFAGGREFWFNRVWLGEQDLRGFFGSSLQGNVSTSSTAPPIVSRTGDPRTLSEQLTFIDHSTLSPAPELTRFYKNIDNGGRSSVPSLPDDSTLGLPAISYVDPQLWPDPNVPLANSATSAYAVIADTTMKSIGELGHVFDPHRKPSAPGESVAYSRGGGRTLKIGQNDDLVAGAARFSEEWKNASWRLTDLFSANTPSSLITAPVVAPGKININSVARDGGVAMRSALRGLHFLPSPHSDSRIAGKPLTDAEIDEIISSIARYVSANGPFMERGELSQIDYFSPASTRTLAGETFSSLNDRGREELFRSVVELVTTRSASFTIYAVGESIRQLPDGTLITTGLHRAATTFHLQPVFNNEAPDAVVSSYKAFRVYEPH